MFLCDSEALICSWCFIVAGIVLLCSCWFSWHSLTHTHGQRDASSSGSMRRVICLDELVPLRQLEAPALQSPPTCMPPWVQIDLYSALFGGADAPAVAAMQHLLDQQNATISLVTGELERWQSWFLNSQAVTTETHMVHGNGVLECQNRARDAAISKIELDITKLAAALGDEVQRSVAKRADGMLTHVADAIASSETAIRAEMEQRT